jgi:hypothetical protein
MATTTPAPGATGSPQTTPRRASLALRRLATPACLLGIVAYVLVLHRAVLGNRAHYPWDVDEYNFPLLYYEEHSMRGGTVPLWDGHTYAGLPLVANPQSALFYPLHLVLFGARIAMSGDLTLRTVQLVDLAHFVIGGLAMFALLRVLSCARRYALLGALLWVTSGFYLAQAQHLGVIETLAWAPLAVALALLLARRPRLLCAVGLAVVLAMAVLAGFLPQAATVIVLAVVVFGVETVRLRPQRWRAGTLQMIAAVIGAGLLSAVALLPIAAGAGSTIPLNAHGGIHAQSALSALMPEYFSPGSLGSYWGPGDITTTYFYAGLPVLVLAGLGLFLARGVANVFRIAFVLTTLLSFSPSAESILGVVHRIPGENNLLRPEDFAPLMAMSATVLAVLTLRDLRRARVLALAAVLAGGAIAAVALATPHLADHHVTHDALIAAAILGGAMVATLLPRGGWKPALALLCVAELFVANSGKAFYAFPGPAAELSPDDVSGDRAVLSELRSLAQASRVSADLRVMGAEWQGGWRVWGIDTVNGFEPQLSQRYFDTVLANGATWHTDRLFDITSYSGPLPGLLDIGYVVTAAGSGLHDPRLVPVWHDAAYTILGVRDATARYLVFDPSAYHCDGTACRIDAPVASGRAARLAHRDANTRDVDLGGDNPAGSLLFASEVWYPGWQATVDGHAAAVVEVDDLVMGVRLPADAHHVALEYRPTAFVAGAAISVLAWLAAAALAVALLTRGRRRQVS